MFRIHPCVPESPHALAHVHLSIIRNGIGWLLLRTWVDLQVQMGRRDMTPYPATNLSKACTSELQIPQRLIQEEHIVRVCSPERTHCDTQQACS
jgi:hypothetical protein